MLLETIIGLGVLIYLLWKYFLPTKQEQIQYEKSEDVQYETTNDANEPVLESTVNNSSYISKKTINDSVEDKRQIFEVLKSDTKPEKQNLISFQTKDLITPSVLLKQRNEKLLDEKVGRRESPPKERLAEFLEKTILSDDKIQSIIQNLSLDKNEILIHEEPAKLLYPTSKEIIPLAKVEGLTLSEKAAKQQDTIDNIADRIKQLNVNTIVKETDHSTEEAIENKIEESKPVLKRLQKQPGFPPGLNFGSVIGELKNKTKNASNGGLKPVFKKFDVDSVDNIQAGFFITQFNKNTSDF